MTREGRILRCCEGGNAGIVLRKVGKEGATKKKAALIDIDWEEGCVGTIAYSSKG